MAYNVLKGNVQFINSTSGSIESIVDDHSNQTIGGIKTFSTAITSSGFFNSSGDGAPIVSSPINTLFGAAEDRIAIFSGSNDLTASTGFTYNQTVLAVTGNISASVNVSGSGFYGSGVGLTALPAASITGQINAANVNIGNGLTNIGGALTISGSDTSMNIGATGISIKGATSTSGLKVGSGGLRADPNRATAIGSLASSDEFLVSDADDSNNLKKATITKLQTYMDNTLSFAKVGGSDTQVFFNDGGSATIGADSTFTFNKTTNILSVSGISASANISASFFYGDGANITNVNATSINGNVPAGNINIGNGLFNNSNSLAVSASFGLTASANGLEVTASSTSGLDVGLALGGLVISPSRTTAKASPVVGDTILLGDSADSNKVKNTTLTSVTTLIKNNGAGGANTQVQFNNSNAFAGDSAFTFNAATNTLAVQEVSSSGNISASFFYGDGSNLQNVGGQNAYNSFTANFNVFVEQDLIGVVTTGSAITASLPSAATYAPGQRVTFKDVSGSCSGSNHIVISASAYGSGNRIDGQGIVKIQTGFGAVTIASDGVNSFFIVGTN